MRSWAEELYVERFGSPGEASLGRENVSITWATHSVQLCLSERR